MKIKLVPTVTKGILFLLNINIIINVTKSGNSINILNEYLFNIRMI